MPQKQKREPGYHQDRGCDDSPEPAHTQVRPSEIDPASQHAWEGSAPAGKGLGGAWCRSATSRADTDLLETPRRSGTSATVLRVLPASAGLRADACPRWHHLDHDLPPPFPPGR